MFSFSCCLVTLSDHFPHGVQIILQNLELTFNFLVRAAFEGHKKLKLRPAAHVRSRTKLSVAAAITQTRSLCWWFWLWRGGGGHVARMERQERPAKSQPLSKPGLRWLGSSCVVPPSLRLIPGTLQSRTRDQGFAILPPKSFLDFVCPQLQTPLPDITQGTCMYSSFSR